MAWWFALPVATKAAPVIISGALTFLGYRKFKNWRDKRNAIKEDRQSENRKKARAEKRKANVTTLALWLICIVMLVSLMLLLLDIFDILEL